ncbi:MAG: energy-coupling factor transporter transmembrane protein EcfT [Candidatus Lokiarchaeota archaeon]|nr:energy-coupling factor transporter transmembrane protein EcfT [Candidatus Lokiarchaeota archaeon]
MDIELPFKHEDEKNFINKIHPLIRFILPFILVVPFLIINDVYLVITIIIFVTFFNLVFRLHLLKIFSKLKALIPFILLITIFVPFYVGNTVFFQLNIGIPLNIYVEGLAYALTLFFRIIGAAFVFLTFFTSLTYSEFIEALTKLRVIPSFFVGSIVIMLHYIPILARSNRKVLEAQDLRGKNFTSYWQRLKTHGFIMGKNVVHNMERSEKLYESLKMRGFSGKITFAPKKMKVVDISIVFSFFTISFLLSYIINLEQIYTEVIKLFF